MCVYVSPCHLFSTISSFQHEQPSTTSSGLCEDHRGVGRWTEWSGGHYPAGDGVVVE